MAFPRLDRLSPEMAVGDISLMRIREEWPKSSRKAALANRIVAECLSESVVAAGARPRARNKNLRLWMPLSADRGP